MTRRDVIYGSLFSGIGGFDLGFDRAGMQCAWQVEIDNFCRQVLAKHWPSVTRFEDIRDVGRHNLSPIDVICGGFPCQPHSVAGKRQGAADDRDLWPEYRRVIDELRPTWVVAENVPGIRTTILDGVLSDLEGLAYSVGTVVVPACAFGAPHIRQRVFILARSMADTESGRCGFPHADDQRPACGAGNTFGNSSAGLADRNRVGLEGAQRGGTHPTSRDEAVIGRSITPPNSGRQQGRGEYVRSGRGRQPENGRGWQPEPDVGRVAYGVPNRVDRIRALGNAVVPQVTEWIGRYIMEIESR